MKARETSALMIVGALVVALSALGALAPPGKAPKAPPLDTARIEQLTGAKGTWNEKEGVFKVGLPRNDLSVTVAGTRMSVPMGLACWAALTRAGDSCMVMGDVALQEDQVNPVMSVALENGLEVTALHNHFLWDSPRILFMHIGGMGDVESLAAAVGKVFAKVRETAGGRGETPALDIDASRSTLDPAKIDAVLGAKGEGQPGGVYKIVIGRTIKMHGHDVGNAMGINTWAAFAGSDDRAVVDGDFVMAEGELQAVLKALRNAKINIVAVHNHMTMEEPRAMFLHFWGIGSTTELARGLRAALDAQKQVVPKAAGAEHAHD